MAPERFQDNDQMLAAYKAGQIDQRLDNHSEHLRAINGSIEQSASELSSLNRVVVAIDTKIKIAGWVAGVFLTAWASAIAYLILHA